MFVPKSAASSTSQEESGNLRRKRPKVEGGSNTTTAATAEVGSQTEKEEIDQEVAQMIFDTGEFFYDLGWNDREQVIVFIINHQTQFVNQLTLQEELNLIDEALVEAVVEAVVEALADGEEEEEVGGDGPAGDGP